MKQLLRKSLILFLLNILCLVSAAQESKNTLVTNNLVLEVTLFKGRSPVSQRIGENRMPPNWAWYALFRRIPDWQPKSGDFPVRAVKIVPYFDDNLVKIRVSVFTGERFHDKEVFVADLEIRENERKVVKELTEFGVEPFELAVVRDVPTVASLPTVVNKTTSLQVVVEPNFSLLPSFKMNLLNNSNKAVVALFFETMVGNQIMLSGMPQGQEGRVLIAPGETFEKAIPNNLEKAKSEMSKGVGSGRNLTLLISSVVFEDGSYEGDAKPVARFRAFTLGRKFLLKQTVPLWQKTAESEIESNSLDKLFAQLSAVKENVDENAFMELIKEFPALNEKEKADLRISLQVAVKGTKREMLGELQEFSRNSNRNSESVQNWLIESGKKYQNWLTRLTK